MVPLDHLQCSGGVCLGRPEVGLGVLEPLPRNSEPARGLQCARPCRQRLQVVPREVVQVPLKVGSNAGVHPWQEGRRRSSER